MTGVPFSEKYEDNKVGKWKDHYVNYSAISKILVEAKKIGAAYETLAKTRPDVAAEFELFSEGGSMSGLGLGTVAEEESESPLLGAGASGVGYGSGGDVEADGNSREAFRAQLAERKQAIDDIADKVKTALLAERDKAAKFYVGEVAVLEHRTQIGA